MARSSGPATSLLRGPAHGAWEHVRGRVYADTHYFFRFESTGTFLSQKIKQRPGAFTTATCTRQWQFPICSIQMETSLPADYERP